jgi:hypothetical protein
MASSASSVLGMPAIISHPPRIARAPRRSLEPQALSAERTLGGCLVLFYFFQAASTGVWLAVE